jgi:serine/threonine protein kinase
MLTETGSIKVMDFGIARISGMARITRDGTLIGTFEYMSPEQILGQQIDARSDIYSLGILLYEWLTGRLPFVSHNDYELLRSHVEETPTPPRDLVPQIPVQVEAAILRALAKAPEARFQTAGEFRMVLETSRFSTEPTLDNQMPGDATPVIGKSEMLMSPDGRQVCGEISPLMKETRQGPADWAPPTDERSTVLSIPIEPGAAQRPAPPANKLHWKQWVSAAAAMFVLVSVVVGLVNRRNTSVTPPPPPPLASPPQTAVVPPPPATQPPVADSVDMKDMLNQPSPPPNPSPAQTAAKSPPRTGTPPHGRKSPAAKNSDPHQQEKVPLENVERRDSQGQKTASAERHDPQEEKKGSKIGGFFRKVGGGVKKVGQMITGGDENPKDTDRAPVDEQKKEKP